MLAPTHVVLALASVVLEERLTGLAPSLAALPVIVLGSLAPDIDNGGAIVRLSRWLRPFIGMTLAWAIELPLMAISQVLRKVFGHRGFMHTPVCCALLFAAGSIMESDCMIHFAWGYATHIAADLCTVSGVPLMGPFISKRVSILPIRTGSSGELLVVGTILAVLALTTWRSVLFPISG